MTPYYNYRLVCFNNANSAILITKSALVKRKERNAIIVLRKLISEMCNTCSVDEYVVPKNKSLSSWKKQKIDCKTKKKKNKKTKCPASNSEYNKLYPKSKWKVVHGKKKGKIGTSLPGMNDMSYSKATKAHSAIKLSENTSDIKILRKYIRNRVIKESSIGRKLDKATGQISRSVIDMLKSSEIRSRHSKLEDGSQLQLKLQDITGSESSGSGVDSSLIDMKNVGSIIVFLEATDSELWTAGAYMYNPEDRSKSELVIALGLPRDYEFEIFRFVIPELKEAIRHELEHGSESTEVLQSATVSAESKFKSKDALVDYYTTGGETAGHITGLYKKAKDIKVSIELVINDFLTDIYNRALSSGMEPEDADDATRKIAEEWYVYLIKRYPESEKHLSY